MTDAEILKAMVNLITYDRDYGRIVGHTDAEPLLIAKGCLVDFKENLFGDAAMSLDTRNKRLLAIYLHGRMDSMLDPTPLQIDEWLNHFNALSQEVKDNLPNMFNSHQKDLLTIWVNK